MRWNGHLTLQKTHARGRIVVVAVVRQETHRLKEPIFRNLWLLNKSSSTVFQVTGGVSNFSVYRSEVRRHEKHINFE